MRAPGKMGPPGSCVPRTYLAWVTMSVDLFAELASRPGVRLVDEPEAKLEPPVEGYHLLESFPTSTWRTAGLTPLPGKARAARIEPYATELRRAFSLPPFGGQIGHDELQAVVAALPAAALLGGPARAVPRGRPSRRVETHRVEGLIWDAAPAERVEALAPEAPLLVIVTGPAASGKTTLARSIAHELRLPLLAKDDVKEALFDTLGTGDRDWSRRLGGASFELLYLLAERLLGAGRPVIMEGNFDVGRAETGFATLRASAPFRPFQIVCGAPSDVLLARCKERAGSGDRHPGHLGDLVLPELEDSTRSGGVRSTSMARSSSSTRRRRST